MTAVASCLFRMGLFSLPRLFRLLFIFFQRIEARRLSRRLESKCEHEHRTEDHSDHGESEVGVDNVWQLHSDSSTVCNCQSPTGYNPIAFSLYTPLSGHYQFLVQLHQTKLSRCQHFYLFIANYHKHRPKSPTSSIHERKSNFHS